METYHALTPIAPSHQPHEGTSGHAITPASASKPAEEPEPSQAEEQPAAIVNSTLEELARERPPYAGAGPGDRGRRVPRSPAL
jgi:hypothetical protein